MAIPQHDATWVTDPESRYQQLLKERDQLAGRVDHLERVLRDRDQLQMTSGDLESGFASASLLSSPTLRVSETTSRLRKSPCEKERREAGLSCRLCYVTTSDNALMERHLMGESHLRNTEKESRQCPEKKEETVEVQLTVHQVEKVNKDTRDKEANGKKDEAILEPVKQVEKVNKKTTDKEANGKKDEAIIRPVKRKEKDEHCGESINETMKETTNAQQETAGGGIEVNVENADCGFCKYFHGDDGKIQKYMIPEHFCLEDISFITVPELPAGWTEKRSRTTGQSYYLNNLTKESQWERPTKSVDFEKERVVGELPNGWVEKMSKSKGCSYYVNKFTKDRQWERPTESCQIEVSKDLSDSCSTSKVVGKLAEEASSAKTKVGMMLSKLRKGNTYRRLDREIKNDFQIWKQTSALWNEEQQ